MENINKFKRELSKLTGVDLFSPKYRDVFKRYFDDEEDATSDEEPNELLEKKGIEEPKDDTKVEKPIVEEPKVETDDKEIENKLEDIDKAEDEREIDKIEEIKADEPKVEEDKKEDVEEESKEIGKDVDEVEDDKYKDELEKYKDELLDTKITLELVKNGVKPERLDSAKKYAKFEIGSIDQLDKIHDLLKEYPEWVQGYKAEDFGHDFDKENDNLTEEEKRLKQMGIDPRN